MFSAPTSLVIFASCKPLTMQPGHCFMTQIKIEMKRLLYGLALCAVWTLTHAASNAGRWTAPMADPGARPPLACALPLADSEAAASPRPQLLAANANCPSDCESRLQLCLKEAKTDAIWDKCKVYFKGCLKTCSQGK
jgi:hypothetical protein